MHSDHAPGQTDPEQSTDVNQVVHQMSAMSLEQVLDLRSSMNRLTAEKIIDAQQDLRDRYAAIMKEIKAVASEYGLSTEQYLGMSRSEAIRHVAHDLQRRERAAVAKVSSAQIPKKYRHPDRPDLEWTGRGAEPRWMREWLEKHPDKSREDLRIPGA